MTEEGKEVFPHPPPRIKRTTGWSEDSNKGTKSRSGASSIMEENLKSVERLTIIDSDDDIPVIPELEEMHADYPSKGVSSSSLAVIQMAKYNDADSDFLKNHAFSGYEEGILRLLTIQMQPESIIKEVDKPMTWQELFTKISSDDTT